jgi:hydroxyacylglutathione hydrolase
MKLFVKSFVFNPIQENTYIVYSESNNAVIIDPGCYFREEKNELKRFIEENNLNVKALLNTHGHIDHVLGNSFVLNEYKIDFYLHKEDLVTLQAVSNYAHLYGFDAYEISPEPNKWLNDNDQLIFDDIKFKVIFGPGHSPGHVAFYNAENSILIGGDILFKGSFGRVDLPGGNLETLKKTIFNKLFTLPENTIVYSGHGEPTTIAVEKKSNYIHQF